MLRRLLAVLIAAVSRVSGATAGPFEDAKAAFERGDYAGALRITQQVAEQGNPAAQNDLGTMYVSGIGVPQDYTEAVKWFRLAAKQGLAKGQNWLGVMYAKGQGVPKDNTEAVKWYQ